MASAIKRERDQRELEPHRGLAAPESGRRAGRRALPCSGSGAPDRRCPRCIRQARRCPARRRRSARRRWPRPLSVSAARISEPDERLRGLLRPSRRNDPRAAARAPSRIAARSASLRASSARSHSLSVPIERRFRLAEPMRSSRSSMIITFECTMVCVTRSPSRTSGQTQADAVADARLLQACAESGCGRCAWCGSRARCRACAARSSALRARASRCSRFASALAMPVQVRNWFSI